MPPKADPRDWDRYFRPGAPRRGGPLRALANIVLICLTLGILGGAGIFAWSFGRERARESANAHESEVQTSNAGVIATRTAKALETATAQAALQAATPTAEPTLGWGQVIKSGNVRKEPLVSDETVLGQICEGDKVDVLEERTLDDGARWYRLRVNTIAENCTTSRASVGLIGWSNASLISELTP
ncbi:MAG: SH3 domain-containing protein [Oscillochloris sp.]|nr:SH3 domain-containing protein [Oscillochloris sp.]